MSPSTDSTEEYATLGRLSAPQNNGSLFLESLHYKRNLAAALRPFLAQKPVCPFGARVQCTQHFCNYFWMVLSYPPDFVRRGR